MEIRFQIDDEFVNTLKKDTGVKSAADLTKEAYTLYRWAISEAQHGRILMSANTEGEDKKQVVMPIIERVKSNA
jgi:hypothetical protein